ncbi:hypothetical protein CC_3348 [Caulobacter vibrioides CB15]|uniref:Uncharacterized protein n=1 Tax=Caulobacter vibrioides (strain ATCC 19089 / CIP 103742 / CB 15) TaxID=190650 RepID=Q9A358_CAUVC|nr:hypothetical protein CC_3348 [Caulobacter vibrioides CB15]
MSISASRRGAGWTITSSVRTSPSRWTNTRRKHSHGRAGSAGSAARSAAMRLKSSASLCSGVRSSASRSAQLITKRFWFQRGFQTRRCNISGRDTRAGLGRNTRQVPLVSPGEASRAYSTRGAGAITSKKFHDGTRAGARSFSGARSGSVRRGIRGPFSAKLSRNADAIQSWQSVHGQYIRRSSQISIAGL